MWKIPHSHDTKVTHDNSAKQPRLANRVKLVKVKGIKCVKMCQGGSENLGIQVVHAVNEWGIKLVKPGNSGSLPQCHKNGEV